MTPLKVHALKKITYYIATTLDGYIASMNGGFDFFEMEGPHIPDHEAFVASCSTVLMGRTTYDIAHLNGVSDPYPDLDTHVFSRTIAESPHPNVRIHSSIDKQALDEILSDASGEVWFCGGGELAGQLIQAGFVDKVILKINPVVIGRGLPLLEYLNTPARLKLDAHTVYENGVVRVDYSIDPSA